MTSGDSNSDAPMWRPEDLGRPIPNDSHAVSVCLPTWAHNVGYEEGDPTVVNHLQAGYPRFFLHPLVRQYFAQILHEYGAPEEDVCYVFPAKKTAEQCLRYVDSRQTGTSRIVDIQNNLFAVLGTESTHTAIKQFWQHSGEILPSRVAELLLDKRSPTISSTQTKQTLKNRVAELADCRTDDVYLFSSGMAAIYFAWQMTGRLCPTGQTVQFGFPYVDTLKIQERFEKDRVQFFPTGSNADLSELRGLASNQSLRAIFCETPTNPLLVTPDLAALTTIARQNPCPLIVDDTLGALINLNSQPFADITVTSLTKYFSGRGDVLAGSLILHPDSPFYSELKLFADKEYADQLFDIEAEHLEENSRDITPRVQQINQTALELCEFLQQHAAVDQVYYPAFSSPQNYKKLQRKNAGFGGLFSFVLHDRPAAERVFDALQISKGPNLGTNFSLACPFTILAHYDELDFAESCGVSRHLIRVSVGLEDPQHLQQVFSKALASV